MWYPWLSMLSVLIAMLLAANFATAAVHWDELLIKHTWNAIPSNWESLGNATAGATINLYIALKPDRESALIDALSEVSNPENPKYGAYLSKEQVVELVNPHPATLELVRAWLVHHGIRPTSISSTHGGSWLTITDVLVPQANQLLGASYQIYRNSKTNDRIIRTIGYALPKVLHSHIRTVAPTTYFPSVRGMRQTPHRRSFEAAPAQAQVASDEAVTARQPGLPGITPSTMRWLYKTNTYKPKRPYQNTLGILGINDDYPSLLDLTVFMAMYRSDGLDARFHVEKVNGGGYNPSIQVPGDTANFGIQYGAAMAYPTPLVFYSIGGDTEWDRDGRPIVTDMYLEWFGNILDDPFPPSTISIGYGEIEQDLPWDYAMSMCDLFARLGVRGVTVLVASGQDGVGAGDCVNGHGIVQFIPEFPSSCPYVTSVGGTTNFRPEKAANLSGGGFSFYFQTPDYQHSVVLEYLQVCPDLYDGLYNPNGRGYPDISAQALNYQFFHDGEMNYIDGTACSVSTVAGIVSLYNDFYLSRWGHSLGFLNPLLYSRGFRRYGFKDVKFGGNPGCGTNGFMAATGWDPATGLGTLDFQGMLYCATHSTAYMESHI